LKKVEFTIPAQIDTIKPIRSLIEKIGSRYAFSSQNIHAVKLAVEEILTNIIRHGYIDTSLGKITIRIIVKLDRLKIVIIDQGISFDPQEVNNPDIVQYIDKGKKGGLGIFMIRRLMDEFYYKISDRGNEIHLTKYRGSSYKSFLHNIYHLFKYPSKLRYFLPMRLDCSQIIQ
jgi:serine/threonine-protein kinase RsbW